MLDFSLESYEASQTLHHCSSIKYKRWRFPFAIPDAHIQTQCRKYIADSKNHIKTCLNSRGLRPAFEHRHYGGSRWPVPSHCSGHNNNIHTACVYPHGPDAHSRISGIPRKTGHKDGRAGIPVMTVHTQAYMPLVPHDWSRLPATQYAAKTGNQYIDRQR